MKKINLFAIGTMLAATLLASCGGSSSSSTSKENPTKGYGLTMPWKKGFRILWLTDIHLGNPTNTANYDEDAEYAHLTTMINQAASPDLIVITGDTFERETTDQVDRFVSFIDSFNLKWAFTYGNHDPGSLIKDSYYINDKVMGAKNSVFVDFENDDIDGLTNYYINLNDGGKNVYRLYIVDSNSYKAVGSGGDSIYDIIHDNQLQHIKNIYQNEGDQTPGLAFFHIPLREYVNAYAGYSSDPKTYQGQGSKLSPFGYGYKNNGALQIMEDSGIIGTFCGHDHTNDFDIDYFDDDNHVVLSYGLKSSDLNYYQEGMVGYKTITLPDDPSTFDHTAIVETKVAYQ